MGGSIGKNNDPLRSSISS